MQDCPTFAASVEPLAHPRSVASLNLFSWYYFGRCSSELAQLVLLPHSHVRSTRYSNRLYDLTLTISRYYNDVYIDSFFPCSARLWNFLPAKSFRLKVTSATKLFFVIE